MAWFSDAVTWVLSGVVRPKLSPSDAERIMRDAADAKGWRIDILLVERIMQLYLGMAFLSDFDVGVSMIINGRSGKVESVDRSDKMESLMEEPDAPP